MMTQCAEVGTPFGVQFAATFQSVLTDPFHVFAKLVTVTQFEIAVQATLFMVDVTTTR